MCAAPIKVEVRHSIAYRHNSPARADSDTPDGRNRITAHVSDQAKVRWSRADTIAVLVVVIAAAVLRLVSLGRPVGLIFDEIFYAQDACWYVLGTQADCGIAELTSRAHPPLGKWLIGSGIALFGYDAFGWRVTAALAGTASVGLAYVAGRRLLHGTAGRAATVGATAASILLATDFLHLVQSRIAMLDAFITLFVVGAVAFAILDRDRPPPAERGPWWWSLTVGRPWRLAAGVFVGAAVATKWSGAYVAPAVIGLVVAWEIASVRHATPGLDLRSAVRIAFRREAIPTLVTLGVVPVLVYLASYIGRMPGDLVALPWQAGSVWRGIWDHQQAMLDFHTTLGGDHPYQSPPLAWPALQRPVAYWFSEENGSYREILALGNPFAWWPGLVALAALAVTWWRARWAVGRPEPVILLAALSTYLPWIVLSGGRSQTFLWYFLPTVPFLALALGTLVAWGWQRTRWRLAVGAYGLVIAISFGFWVPLLTALPQQPDAWRTRILFTDCDRPDGSRPTLPDDSTSSGAPPGGWCWI